MVTRFHTIFIRRLFICLPVLWLSLAAQGQDPPPPLPDTSDVIIEPVDDTDDDDPVDDEYVDEPVTNSIYWVRRELQPGGGGPGYIVKRNLHDSSTKKYIDDKDFWYANYPFEKKAKESNEQTKKKSFTQNPVFQTLLWIIIIGGFATFIIIYLSNSNVGLFRRRDAIIKSDDELEVETSNIFEINYTREIEKAISKGNYRFAIRLLFLQTLKNMSAKNIIQYKPDRTDFDYLLQTYSTKYYNDFFRLTRTYEYAWYGQFDVDPEKFRLIHTDFQSFENKLS